jgi:hypothetical protein
VDAASGTATIDLPALWKKSLPTLKQPHARMALERQADAMRSEFRRLTGRPLPAEKFAFAVPLEVAVADAEGQQDRLNLAVIVLAPAEDLGKPPEGPVPMVAPPPSPPPAPNSAPPPGVPSSPATGNTPVPAAPAVGPPAIQPVPANPPPGPPLK